MSSLRRTALTGFAAWVFLNAAFINYLNFAGPDDWPIELWRSGWVLLLVALFPALLISLPSRFIRSAVWSGIVIVFLDLCGASYILAGLFGTDPLIWIYAVAFLLLALGFLGLKEQAARVLVGVSLIFLVTTIVGVILSPAKSAAETERTVAAAPGPASESLPDLLHIILDEHIGTAGARILGYPELIDATTRFDSMLTKAGLTVYPAAYSHYRMTVRTIPSLVNFDVSPHRSPYANSSRPFKLESNRYFVALRSAGYALDVYHPGWVELCTPGSAGCTESSYRTIPQLHHDRMEGSRSPILRNLFFAVSRIYRHFVRRAYYGLYRSSTESVRTWLPEVGTTVGAASLSGLDLLASVAPRRQTDFPTATVVHVLLPHSPQALDSNCMIKPFDEWIGRDMPWIEERPDRYANAYAEQIDCANRALGDLLTRFSRPTRRPLRVMVHSDHGSRQMSTSQSFPDPGFVADHYSILAAVTSGADSVSTAMPVSVTSVFRKFLCGEPRVVGSEDCERLESLQGRESIVRFPQGAGEGTFVEIDSVRFGVRD